MFVALFLLLVQSILPTAALIHHNVSINITPRVPAYETTALIDLYEFNGGENWFCDAKNWSYAEIENSPCKLYGVSCNLVGTQMHVTHLELPRCGLTGLLLHSFSNLTKLTYLDLSFNFGSNHSQMPFPPQLKSLKELRVLRLNNTGLNGTIPFWTFETFEFMQYFDVSFNNLSGPIPNSIASAKELKSLSIHHNCGVNGTLPIGFYKLQNLKSFIFYNTNISGRINENYISQMINFEMLLGASTQISGTLPKALFELPKLKYFDLSHCKIGGTLPNSIGKSQKLQILNLAGNHLSGPIPENIFNLSELVILYLHNNKLNGTLSPMLFENMKNIQMISLNNNKFEGNFPNVPKNNLKIFDISNNKFFGFLNFFNELKANWRCNLSVFYVNDNEFSGPIPFNLNTCDQLKTIALHNNKFDGPLPDFAFSALNGTNITKLSLHNNEIRDNNLEIWLNALFAQNSYLEFLSIYGNLIGGKLSAVSAPNLHTFLAHDCMISGVVPNNFINNSVLVNITLFDNRLSCDLPQNLIESDNVNYANTTVMFLLGNMFSTKDKLPNYINPDFGKAVNLYIDVYETFIQSATLYFSLFACIPFIIFYNLRKIYRRFCGDGDGEEDVFVVEEDENFSFFGEIEWTLNVITHWFVLLFVLWLIVIYGMNSTYYECANVFLHFSLVYMEGNALSQQLIACSFVVGNALILIIIFTAYRREKFEKIMQSKMRQQQPAQFKKNKKNKKKNVFATPNQASLIMDGAIKILQESTTQNSNFPLSFTSPPSKINEQNSLSMSSDENILNTPSYIIGQKEESLSNSLSPIGTATMTMSAIDFKMQNILFDKTSDSVKHDLKIEECGCFSGAIYVFLWLFTLIITIIFFVTISLPYDNTLRMGQVLITTIEYSLGFVLSICNIFVVPKISDYLIFLYILIRSQFEFCECECRWKWKLKKKTKIINDRRRTNHYEKRKFFDSTQLYKYRALITACLRSVNLIWIPFVVAIFFENDCGGGWSLLWDPCQNETSANKNELTVFLDLSGTQQVVIREETIFNLTDEAPITIRYGSIAPMLTPQSICFDSDDLKWSGLTQTSDCIRAVLSAWSNILIIKMCVNIFVLAISAISMYFSCTRNNLWLRIKPHVRMDKEYASILSHLEIAIVLGYISPIIIPIIGVVIIVTMYFYKMSLKMGRNLTKSEDANFPILFLLYPISLQNFLLVLFFHIAEFEGKEMLICGFAVTNFVFVASAIMLKCGYKAKMKEYN